MNALGPLLRTQCGSATTHTQVSSPCVVPEPDTATPSVCSCRRVTDQCVAMTGRPIDCVEEHTSTARQRKSVSAAHTQSRVWRACTHAAMRLSVQLRACCC